MHKHDQINRTRKSSAFTCGCVSALAILASVIAYQLHNREPQLLARSRPIAVHVDTKSQCYWLSLHTLLLLNPQKSGYSASTYDVIGRVPTQMPSLERLLSGADVNSPPILSPNGNWLLTQQSVNGWFIPVAVSVDGSQRELWPNDDPSRLHPRIPDQLPMWLRDNRHWLEFKTTNGLVQTLMVRHGIGERDKDLGKWYRPDEVFGQDRKGRLLAYRMAVGSQVKHSLLSYDPANGALTGETVLPIDFDSSLSQISLSPGGDRVALVSVTGGDPMFPNWLTNIIPSIRKSRKPYKLALWVCGTDGKGLHELGCSAENVHPFWPGNLLGLKWLPDGKSISFTYKNRLWITPVD